MLSMIENLKCESGFLPISDLSKQLPCTVWGAGKEVQTPPHYDWDGLKRGHLDLSTFQYTLRGCGKLCYESRDYEIPPGHAMLVRFPHNHRYWIPKNWEPWELIWVSLYGKAVQNLWVQLEQKFGPVVPISEDSPIFETYFAIHESLFQQPLLSPFKISALGYQFSMNVMDELTYPHEKTKRLEIQKVVRYCQSHLGEKIGVEEMADISGFSRYHFTRLFRQMVGMPPGGFLRNLRMRKGAQLLRSGQYRVKEVAHLCGFEDTNNFCRAFKKIYGFSPGAFKKKRNIR